MQETKSFSPHFLAVGSSSRISVQERFRKGNAEGQGNQESDFKLGYMTLFTRMKRCPSSTCPSLQQHGVGGTDRPVTATAPLLISSFLTSGHVTHCPSSPPGAPKRPQLAQTVGSCSPPPQGCVRKGEQVGSRMATPGTWEPGMKGTGKVRTMCLKGDFLGPNRKQNKLGDAGETRTLLSLGARSLP